MANEMIKFYKGLEASLPAAGTNGALYITTDEGAIYLGTGNGMKRLGDFVQVANVASLPAKAHETCLYYCVAENILAKWNGAEWKQVNKQPTPDELKTLLGLGSMAYKSTVAETDLDAALAEKVNAAAEGNHAHSNKGVLDGITADKVSAWDSAEGNAKAHADELDSEMNKRVEALEAIDHEHANKALLDTYTQTESDLADAVAKKHAHANADELAKIADGDKAKWDAVAADHLTAADKTALENSIKEAKKAGTDANTNIETYKVSNDARVKAVEDDIAEITDAEGGILAQANSAADSKISAARTLISAEIDADVKVVADDLAGYKTSNNEALAGVKATAEAAATKAYTDEELAKKVDKVTGKSLVSDTEITKLAGVSAGANKVEASANNGSIKIDGVETVVYTHPDKHAISDVTGLQNALDGKQAAGNYSEVGHKHVKADITDFAHTHTASEITDLDATIKNYDYATKTELGNVDKKFENYKTAVDQKAIDDEQDRRLGVIEGDYLKAADIADFETKENVQKVAKDLAEYVESNDKALADVKATAEAARTEAEVNAQIDSKIEGLNLGATYEPIGAETRAKNYVDQKFTDANLDQYTTEQEVKDIVDGVIAAAADDETYNSLTKLIDYVDTHKGEALDMAEDISTLEGDVKTLKEAPSAGIKATDITAWNGEIGAKALAESKTTTAEVKTQIEAYGYATTGYADGKAADAQANAIADAAGKYETKGTAQGIVDGLKLAETYEPIGAEGRAIAEAEKKVNALADNVYAKTETFTKEEVNDAIAAAVTEACSWGSF